MAPGVTESDIQRMVDAELRVGEPRSAVYRAGVEDVLRLKCIGRPLPRRYRLGSVEADAYFAGNDRGHILWRRLSGGDYGH